MIFSETRIPGVFVVELQKVEDERGYSARTWCEKEFAAAGIAVRWVQSLTSFNARRGTLRGMHFQSPPNAQGRLVRCTRGAVHDVVLDLRAGRPTYKQWIAIELTADNGKMIYIPQGLAHGYQTLADDTELSYLMSEFYDPASDTGVRWNDPAFGIAWPPAERILSPRDRDFPDFAG